MLSLVCLAFYLSRPQIDRNYGGMTSGLRWMFWFAPLWLVAMLPAADRLAHSRAGRGLALVLLALSVLSASYPTWNPWTHPWLWNFLSRTWAGGLEPLPTDVRQACDASRSSVAVPASLHSARADGRQQRVDLSSRVDRMRRTSSYASVQRDRPQPLVFVLRSEGNRRPVVHVAQHRKPARRGLHANLVRAAGLELDLQPRAGRWQPTVR